jgi:CelD/BcsL family acetyltransferase involved in cellulose biosynthesis
MKASLAGKDWQALAVTEPGNWLGLGAEWDELYQRCSTATPFQTHAWLTSWWQHYGRGHELLVVLVRRGGRLLAGLPLLRARRFGCRVLSPIGGALSDFTDILLDDDQREEAGQAAIRALLDQPDWDVMDFPETRPGSAVGYLGGLWPRQSRFLPASTCLAMAALPIEEQLARIGGRSAGKLRRSLRKVDELDVEIADVPPERVESAVDGLLRLHAQQWTGRGINKEHLRPRFRNHLSQAACLMVASGQASVTEFRADGRLVAANLCLIGRDFSGGYLYGADPALRSRIDTFALVLRHSLREAHERGLPTLSMLRGAESHKARWGAHPVASHRLVLGRNQRALFYTALIEGRGSAAAVVKDHWPVLARIVRPGS